MKTLGSLDVCGDGIRAATEACDDGNTVGGDGCSADCQKVEFGFKVGDMLPRNWVRVRVRLGIG